MELKEDSDLQEIIENQQKIIAKQAIDLGIIEEPSELNFRGLKLIFTTEDESAELDANLLDEDFDSSDYE